MKKTLLNLDGTIYARFTKVNPNTQKAARLKYSAECMSGYTLDDLYRNASIAKQRAYDDCFALFCKDKHSAYFAVGNANSMCFSACWYTVVDGYKCLAYITKSYNYLVPLYRES